MSIAEKLTIVAENIPKVYEAGFADGKAEGGGVDGVEWDFNWKQFENNTDEMIMPDGEKSVNFTDSGIIGETAYFGKNLIIHCAGETLSFVAGYGSNAKLIVNGVEYTKFPCTFDKVYMETDIEISLGDGHLATPDGQIEFDSENMKKLVSKELDEFWNNYQTNGTRKQYHLAFGGVGWNDKIFKPKYDIKPTTALMMFRYSNISGDLKAKFEGFGITFDTSNCDNFGYMFQQATKITKIGTIDMSKSTSGTDKTDAFFNGCSALEEIELIRTDKEEFYKFGNTAFNNCSALKRIRFEGKIVEGVRFSYSPLDLESAINIISNLKDYSGTDKAGAYTIYFSSSTLKLLDADGATASPNGNSWRDYIDDLGWNC